MISGARGGLPGAVDIMKGMVIYNGTCNYY